MEFGYSLVKEDGQYPAEGKMDNILYGIREFNLGGYELHEAERKAWRQKLNNI